MAQINIPPREIRRWTGPYLGKYYGVLWKTFGIDLDRDKGQVMLSRRMEHVNDTDDIPGTAVYSAFTRTDADCEDRYWAIRLREGLAKTDSDSSPTPADSWDTDAISSSPVTPVDFTIHGNDSRNDSGRNKLFVTLDSGDIAVLNDTGNVDWTPSWWITKHSQATLDTAVLFRPIEYFPFRKITLVGSGNLIHTIHRPSDTQNDTLSFARLTLPKTLNAQHIFNTSNRAWILTHNNVGGDAKVVSWDGFSESYNDIYSVHGMAALSGVDWNGVPIILNDRGKFLEFTGNGFTPMIRNGQEVAFPLPEGASLVSGDDTDMLVSVAPRGMTISEDKKILINVKNATVSSDRFSAGIWSLDPLTGQLYNKTALGQWGDSVDYGHQRIATAGGLYWVPSSVSSRNILAGGITNTTDTAGAETGIWLQEAETSTTPTKGYFITQYIPSDNIKEAWDTIWLKFQRFITSGSQFTVKARGTRPLLLANRRPLQGDITWVSATTFTLTLASGDDALAVKDEVEVLNGTNAGRISHIITITGNHASQQTITIEDTMTTSSGSSVAYFERWKKVGTISNADRYEGNVSVGIESSFIQLKVVIEGLASEMELSEMILNSDPSIKVKK